MEAQQIQKQSGQRWLERVIGQEVLWDRLHPSIVNGRFPHLSLFSGNPGNCQLALSLAIAQALLCEHDERPCGQCSACKQVFGLKHPDLHFSFPVPKAKDVCQDYYAQWRDALLNMPYLGIADWFGVFEEESKNANIPVAEVHNIIEQLQLKPFVASVKVLILWLPEYLGKESNRLLKLFEEPPQQTFILLVTEQPEALLPTVRSRAQQFQLNAIPHEKASKYFVEHYACDEAQAVSALISSDSNLQEAIHLLQNKREEHVTKLQQLLQICYQYQASEMVAWVDIFSKWNREDQKFFLLWFQRVLSFVLRNQYTGNFQNLEQSSDLVLYSKKLSNTLQLAQMEQINRLIDDALQAIPRNANVKILMTDFAIQLASVIRTKLN